MLEKFKNKDVYIRTVGESTNWERGIITRVDKDFIELEYKGKVTLVSIKYITSIREI